MIAIIDYGMGNLRSVEKAFQHLGFDARITHDPKDIEAAARVVLPGVGAFGDGVKGMRERGLIEPALAAARAGKPFIGICLGMQLLLDSSEESPGTPGLGLIPGVVERFQLERLKVPHMGWNSLDVRADSRLFGHLGPNSHVYFVHSYFCKPVSRDAVAAESEYGIRFAAGLEAGNVFGAQFHPEKSQAVGLGILRRFATL